jgi:hypothetical protein
VLLAVMAMGALQKGAWAAVVCCKGGRGGGGSAHGGGHECGEHVLVVGSMTLMFVVSGSKNLCLSVW